MKSIIEKVKDSVNASKFELINLCSKLIQISTVNPPGYTDKCVEFIKSYFAELGLKTTIHEREEGKSNICVEIPGRPDEKVIWLGHLDVVSEGSRDNWNYDPFEGVLIDNKIYGRGSTDMKGSCAAAMVAARTLLMLDNSDHSTVEFWFTCDEEVGGINGTRWLAERGMFKGDACIVGDSFGSLPGNPGIDLGCKSIIQPVLNITGKVAHGGEPFFGDNAIEKLISVVGCIKKIEELPLEIPEELEPVLRSSINFLLSGSGLTESQKIAIKKLFHFPSVSLNVIKGGVKVNLVPDAAEAIFDIRITPGIDLDDVLIEIHNLVKNSGVEGVSVKTIKEDGYYESSNSGFVSLLKEAVKSVTGVLPVLKILTGGTDAVHIKKHASIPCLGFGSGMRGLAHTPNEYVTVENLLMAAKTYVVLPIIYKKDR